MKGRKSSLYASKERMIPVHDRLHSRVPLVLLSNRSKGILPLSEMQLHAFVSRAVLQQQTGREAVGLWAEPLDLAHLSLKLILDCGTFLTAWEMNQFLQIQKKGNLEEEELHALDSPGYFWSLLNRF